MKKTVAVILVVAMLLAAFSGCSINPKEDVNTAETHEVIDMAGRHVDIPNNVSRYVVLWVGAVDIAIMLDQGEHMVGCSDTAASYAYFKPTCKNYDNLVYFNKDAITVEGILDAKADVVFYRGADHAELAEQLTKAGIAAVDVEFNNYDDLFKATKIMADVFGTEYAQKQCSDYCNYAEESIATATKIGESVSEKKTILVIRDTSNLRAYGVNRFAGRWATLCGGDYSLKEGDPDGYVNLTKEQLLEYDPDIIVFVIPGEAEKFIQDPQWSALNAVRNNQVYENPSVIGTWSNHGTEFVLQFWWATGIMYPDLVNYDTSDTVKSFYHEFYGLELDNEEIARIIKN